MKVLIVDDQIAIVKMVCRRLKKCGYEVESAGNGIIGMEKAWELKPDILLMDMHMPEMNGYDATVELRKQNYKGLIIALTASAMSGETSKAIEAGCNYIITKPVYADFEAQLREHYEDFQSKNS